jgi:hypothetical protein
LSFPSKNQQSSIKSTKQYIHLPNTLPFKAFQLQSNFHSEQTSPPLNPIPNTHNTNTMASAMYRPTFSRSGSTSNASVSSKSSSTPSTRAVYTRDGQGFDFSESYLSAGIPAEAEALVGRPAFTRAEYSRDARGQNIDFTGSYKFSKQQTTSSRTPFKGCAYAKDGKGFDFSLTYKGRQ